MSVHPDDVFKLADQIRYDLTAAQAKLTELKTMLGALNLKPPRAYVCPHCDIDRPSQQLLDQHFENVHGIMPTHFVEHPAA